MKKVFGLTLMVMTLVVGLASCKFSLDSDQEKMYTAWIEQVEMYATPEDISADRVAELLAHENELLAGAGKKRFMIKDTKAGNPVAKGTKADELKKRFIPAKAK